MYNCFNRCPSCTTPLKINIDPRNYPIEKESHHRTKPSLFRISTSRKRTKNRPLKIARELLQVKRSPFRISPVFSGEPCVNFPGVLFCGWDQHPITKHFRYLKWRNPKSYTSCMDRAYVRECPQLQNSR